MATRDSFRTGETLEEGTAPVADVVPVDGLIAPEAYAKRQPQAPAVPSEVAAAPRPDEATEPPARPGTASGVDMAWLRSTVIKAGKTAGQERRSLGDQINEAFQRLAQSGGSRQVADFLLKQLEAGGLKDLSDSEGRSCRGRAVEALLAMGYPYALEVAPEDLEQLREETGAGAGRFDGWAGWGLASVVVSSGVELARTLSPATESLPYDSRLHDVPALVWIHVGLAVVSSLVAAFTRQETAWRRLSLAVLVMSGMLGALLFMNGQEPPLLGVVGSLVAAMLLARRE